MMTKVEIPGVGKGLMLFLQFEFRGSWLMAHAGLDARAIRTAGAAFLYVDYCMLYVYM